MDWKKQKFIVLIVLVCLIISLNYFIYEDYNSNTITVANWNIQTFGQTKAANLELMDFYKEKINDYDIIFIQEIRDISDTAFPQLCSMLENYSCFSSSRAGRTSYKEQYGVIYRDTINMTSFKDYNPDLQDRWERPPIMVSFEIENYEFTAYNFHAKPDDVSSELNYLEEIILLEGNVILLGDLNADCSYYNPPRQKELDDFVWVIKDFQDTSSSILHCAYDRILLNSDAYGEYRDSGINSEGITQEVSDHYLVWVELEI